jgi:hypothetical protein
MHVEGLSGLKHYFLLLFAYLGDTRTGWIQQRLLS